MKPPEGVEGACGRGGVLEVAGEDVWAPHQHLARIALDDVVAVGVDDPDLDAGKRQPDSNFRATAGSRGAAPEQARRTVVSSSPVAPGTSARAEKIWGTPRMVTRSSAMSSSALAGSKRSMRTRRLPA